MQSLMASTILKPRYVRCQKCLEVLEEPQGFNLYKCGGCGTTLQSKVHSSSGEILSSGSAAGSSKNISDSGFPHNQKEKLEKQTPSPSSSYHPGVQDQKLTGSSGERNVEEFSGIGIKTHVSDSSGESLKQKDKSTVFEKNGIKGITLEKGNQTEQDIPSKINKSLNEEPNVSSEQGKIPAANNSLKSSENLEESSESLEYDSTSKDDQISGKFRKDTSFLLRKNSHAYDGSVSSTDEERKKHIPQKHLDLTRRTFEKRTSPVISGKLTSRNGVAARERDFSFASEDFQSALNWIGSENEGRLRSKSKDTNHFVKFRCSEKDDKVKIIRKVDELKHELLEFFQRAADAKDEAVLGLTTHLDRKIPPKHYRSSSRIPLSKQPNSTCLNSHHGVICCHNSGCHLPESTTSHLLHMKRCPSLRREPQNIQSNDIKPQTVKRHCRPVSGGAPFVICYRCYKLLHLPADFLVSTKRVYKLRCGFCDEVLRYFFRPRTRSMPWTPAEARHPPSEEDNKEVLDDQIRVPVSNDLAVGDPVSYSEDYGISFGKSYSYEADPYRHIARDDGIVEEGQSGEKVSGSQLHKLMGYSSARYLLFETLSPGAGHRMGQDR